MKDIFPNTLPPAGAGDCCAPKLLQYAYIHHLKPVAMGEFWMGRSPKGEIREEGHFYPACQHKCKPILTWMLRGLDVEENPLRKDYDALMEHLKIVAETPDFVVVDKPSGMLSVPGKDDLPSLQDIVAQQHPEYDGPFIVHRLDMDTSGLMVLALNDETYKELQQQFIRHEIKKRYSALLERPMTIGEKGVIDLPLCPTPNDRPRQIVHEQYGRRSITRYEVVDNVDGHALLHFWPETGRTHQLRVHAAHSQGLNNPILGDRLYGNAGGRLMLQADRLSFALKGESYSFEINNLI
jgi:tRNA pseudouridine32 synthase/23S rRNA pseudouridine746 synthase